MPSVRLVIVIERMCATLAAGTGRMFGTMFIGMLKRPFSSAGVFTSGCAPSLKRSAGV